MPSHQATSSRRKGFLVPSVTARGIGNIGVVAAKQVAMGRAAG